MPTIKDVARLAGTSTATVSYVFNGRRKVGVGTEQRVRRAAAELGYVPNQAARTLATKSSRTIAAVLSDVANPFFAPMLRGVEEVARERGYLVLVGDSNERVDREEEYLEKLVDRYIDGLLLSPASEQRRPPRGIEAWAGRLVLVNRTLDGVKADLVTTDNRAGALAATRHLLELGHRHIAMIAGPRDVSTHAERVAGYDAAFSQAGLEPTAGLVRFVGLDAGSSYAATRALLESGEAPRPTAIFCASGIHAVGSWQALLELSVAVPGDVSFITFDRPTWTDLVAPPLTTVEQPGYDMGRTATTLLLDAIQLRAGGSVAATARHVRLEPTLHRGASVAQAPERPTPEGGARL